jgi:hypothetical protein
MEALRMEATVDTPGIILDPANNEFEISGKSYPEDTKEFYHNVLHWMDLYVVTPNPKTNFVFKLKYFNSSSYKPIFDIFTKLEMIKNKKFDVKIEWHYKTGDSDMLEAGEEFADLFDLPFTYNAF